MEDQAAPDYLRCPVTLDVMDDPVSTVDGQTYERRAIQGWFDGGRVTSPSTGLRLEKNGALDLSLVRIIALKSAIEHWTAEQHARRGFRTIDAGLLRLNVFVNRDLASITQQEMGASSLFADVETLPEVQVKLAELGGGQDKSAYRGFWEGKNVALLLVRRGTCDTEAKTFTKLGTHPHLITFFGLSVLPNGKQSLVVELAPMGSLDNVLEAQIEGLRGMSDSARSKMLLEVVSQVRQPLLLRALTNTHERLWSLLSSRVV